MTRLAIALLVGLSGCAPRLMYDLPRAEGTLVRGSAPVAGAEVWHTTTAGPTACAEARDSVAVTTTDAAGRFELASATYEPSVRWRLPGLRDYGWEYAACFRVNGADSDVKWPNFGGPVPAFRRLTCNADSGHVRCAVDDSHRDPGAHG